MSIAWKFTREKWKTFMTRRAEQRENPISREREFKDLTSATPESLRIGTVYPRRASLPLINVDFIIHSETARFHMFFQLCIFAIYKLKQRKRKKNTTEN